MTKIIQHSLEDDVNLEDCKIEKLVKFNQNTDFNELRKTRYYILSGIQKKCWDKDQMCLFGSSIHKSSVHYIYIPANHMEENIPFIIGSSITYDGGKEQEIATSKGDICLSLEERIKFFTLNKFV